jgi:hypothetical protein
MVNRKLPAIINRPPLLREFQRFAQYNCDNLRDYIDRNQGIYLTQLSFIYLLEAAGNGRGGGAIHPRYERFVPDRRAAIVGWLCCSRWIDRRTN